MRALIQRVTSASVTIDGTVRGEIKGGLLVLLGIGREDTAAQVPRLVRKVLQLRIFADAEDRMNLDVQQTGGGVLVISQFTLYADTRKGNRPSYVPAAHPDQAIPLYEQFLAELRAGFAGKVAQGEFGADMQVALVNDGPVTIALEV